MHLGVGCDWKFSIGERAQAMRVGLCSRGKAKVEVEFKGEGAGREAVKAMEHFIDVKSGGRLSERVMPENGCQGPAKLK